ncbi:heme exporter protein CcmB [candidate division KSB1 bacterium]|nr:heme exporter protein CcmB [candidate division KSB1 bacterium]
MQQIAAIAWKDLLSEFRSRDTVFSMLVFCLLVVVIFSFTFDPGSTYAKEAAPGILWVAFTFSGMLGLNRTFSHEVETGSIHGVLLAPLDHGAIYLGKLIGSFVFMFFVEMITLPVIIVFFDLNLENHYLQLFTIILLATIGFVAVGTLFSAMTVHTKTRELMLPILLFPVMIPVILSAVNATSAILNLEEWENILGWIRILIAFDIVFVTISYLTFSYVVEE